MDLTNHGDAAEDNDNRASRTPSQASRISLSECELLEDYSLDLASLVLDVELGRGNFSVVNRGTYQGRVVAVKKQRLTDSELERYLRKELAVLRRCNHPNLVKYIGAGKKDAETIYIVTEYMPGGDLRRLLAANGTALGWKMRCKVASEIAKALRYLHERGIIHRDVKTENVLLDEKYHVKLCDFGFARKMDAGRVMTMCGTDEFMAPEVLFGMPYDDKADVFSYGVLLAELITTRKPGKDGGYLDRQPKDGFTVDMEELKQVFSAALGAPQSLVLLAEECLQDESVDRPSIQDVDEWLEELLGELPDDAAAPPSLTESSVLAMKPPGRGSNASTESTGDLVAEMHGGTPVQNEQFGRVSAAVARTSVAFSRMKFNESFSSGNGSGDTTVGHTPQLSSMSSAMEATPPGAPSGQSGPLQQQNHPFTGLYKQGFVVKRGGRFKSWKKRFMVLTDEGLVYFKTQADFESNATPQGAVLFENMVELGRIVCSRVPTVKTGKPNSFQVHTQARNYFMSAESEAERKEWLRVIAGGFKAYHINKFI